MKRCPHCGKSLPDYASKCKYCETPLKDVSEEAPETSLEVLQCPACGAPIRYEGEDESCQCPYCRNTVVMPAGMRKQAQTAVSSARESFSLSDEVEQSLQEGLHDKAIELLRNWGSLRLDEAEDLVDRIESGEYGEVRAQILDAMNKSR
ncbi:MAG: hypothetical protein P4L50_04615 [Anaerolineaceae bacterium]|nr:hypothetical protein [Anaerolineaceae bacterium]